MSRFLDRVYEYSHLATKNNWLNTTFIFPNNRSCYYFKELLKIKLLNGDALPEILTLEGFISNLSPITQADDLDLTLELFHIYKNKFPDIEIKQFISIASTMLSDFNELESELVNIDAFFSNLRELKSINVFMEEDFEKAYKYKYFWNAIEECYRHLKSYCDTHKIGTSGMTHRFVSENISNLITKKKEYFIVGFTQISKSDLKIIQYLKEELDAKFIIDTDKFYLEDTNHLAGFSYRKNLAILNIKKPTFVVDRISNENVSIDIFACNGKNQQIQSLINSLKENDFKTDHYSQTAILLPDPNLLPHLIAQMPEKYKDANISMGLKFSSSLFCSLFESIEECLRFSKEFENGQNFHIKRLLKIFENPLILNTYSIIDFLKNNSNTVFIAESRLAILLQNAKYLYKILNHSNSYSDFFDALHNLTKEIKIETKFEQNIKLTILNFLEKKEFNDFKRVDISPHDFLYILLHELKKIEIPFDVNPLTGLQIMGIRESRNLDFDTVFILSMNEAQFPNSSHINSYIPHELRQFFLSPTIESDSINSYLFYRLFHNAKKIHLYYNKQDKLGVGEASRFISQSKLILSKLKNITVSEYNVIENWENDDRLIKSIIKTDEIIEKTSFYLSEKGLSPSAINTYVNCKMQFYYKYILSLKPIEEIEEDIGYDVIGSTVHNALEIFYKPLLLNQLSPIILKKRLAEVDFNAVISSYLENEIDSKIITGKNLLLKKVVHKLVVNFINNEIQFLDSKNVVIKSLEENLSIDIEVNKQIVKLKGFVDRIDIVDGTLRIIDYKTGKKSTLSLKEEDFNLIFSDPTQAKKLQLLMYAYLFTKLNNHKEDIETGIFWLQKNEKELYSLTIHKSKDIGQETIQKFESILKETISEILNPILNFEMTDDAKRCEYCDFKTLCFK